MLPLFIVIWLSSWVLGYALYRGMGREVLVWVLTVATLFTFAGVPCQVLTTSYGYVFPEYPSNISRTYVEGSLEVHITTVNLFGVELAEGTPQLGVQLNLFFGGWLVNYLFVALPIWIVNYVSVALEDEK